MVLEEIEVGKTYAYFAGKFWAERRIGKVKNVQKQGDYEGLVDFEDGDCTVNQFVIEEITDESQQM